ncbi:hypothetical protein D3C75_816340 [compost metagenome]
MPVADQPSQPLSFAAFQAAYSARATKHSAEMRWIRVIGSLSAEKCAASTTGTLAIIMPSVVPAITSQK